jgi:hypothetical protein
MLQYADEIIVTQRLSICKAETRTDLGLVPSSRGSIWCKHLFKFRAVSVL